MTITPKSSQERALQFLQEQMAIALKAQVPRLPTIRDLARAARVSVATMNQAVQQLRDQGIVSVSPKQGIRPTALQNGLPRQTKGSKWETTRHRIEQDVLDGHYDADSELPSLSELSRRYGASHAVIRKAVMGMLEDKVLLPHPRGFKIPGRVQAASTACILFLTRADEAGNLVFFSDRVLDFDGGISRACAKVGVTLIKVGILPEAQARLALRQIKSLREKYSVVGTILWKDCFSERLFRSLWLECIESEHPVAIIDETGNALSPLGMKTEKLTRVFTIAAHKAGYSAARFLIQKGHRKVAFLSNAASSVWSTRRLKGVQDAFSQAGLLEGLHIFQNDFTVALPELEPGQLKSDCARIHKMFDKIREAGGMRSRALQTYEMYNTMHEMQLNQVLFRKVHDWLVKIAEDKTITAVIGVTDTLAFLMLDHLLRATERKPETLSLLGFDDSRLARLNGLTSYSFNFEGLARVVLDFILSPSHPQFSNSTPLEFSGIVMERKSTETTIRKRQTSH